MKVDCDNSHIPPAQRLKSIFTKDAEGNVAIRTMNVVGCSENAIQCDDTRDVMTLLAQAIGLNECGKPALRLAQPE